ncbi:hypothetical protein DL763_007520 [Monosporascus cannonballus]|nr:hypothetical protein DL763_007520 [Monosporascus cannonballus]
MGGYLVLHIFSHLKLYGLASLSSASRNVEGPAKELLWAGIEFHGRCYHNHTASRAPTGRRSRSPQPNAAPNLFPVFDRLGRLELHGEPHPLGDPRGGRFDGAAAPALTRLRCARLWDTSREFRAAYQSNGGLDHYFGGGIDDPEGWRYYTPRPLVLGLEEPLVFPTPKLLHLCKPSECDAERYNYRDYGSLMCSKRRRMVAASTSTRRFPGVLAAVWRRRLAQWKVISGFSAFLMDPRYSAGPGLGFLAGPCEDEDHRF